MKAGIYLLARLNPALGGTDAWHYIIMLAGTLTLVIGAVLAYGQTDLKRLLAYHSISQMGYVVLALGVGAVVLSRPDADLKIAGLAIFGGLFHLFHLLSHRPKANKLRMLQPRLRYALVVPADGILGLVQQTG